MVQAVFLGRVKNVFFSRSFFLSFSSVPAVHLITTVYIAVVRTKECVYVKEAGE